MKQSDRLKSFSSNELDSPVIYRPVTNTSPSISRPRPRPLSSYGNMISSKSTTNLQRIPSETKLLSAKNSPNSWTPNALQSPVFKFPPSSLNSSRHHNTAPSPAPGNSTFKKPFFTIRPVDKNTPPPLTFPPALSPPPTPSRNEYNRYRDAAMASPLLSKHFYLPPLPNSPRPRPAASPSLSKTSEFKIQRPQLSPSTSPLADRSNISSSVNVLLIKCLTVLLLVAEVFVVKCLCLCNWCLKLLYCLPGWFIKQLFQS